MDNKTWNKIFRKNTITKLNEAKTINLGKTIDTWLNKHQKMYEDFLNKLLLGKTIRAKAMKNGEKRHSWEYYTIEKIKDVATGGGMFFGEVSVADKDGKYYTLSDDKIQYLG